MKLDWKTTKIFAMDLLSIFPVLQAYQESIWINKRKNSSYQCSFPTNQKVETAIGLRNRHHEVIK
jgi:hypothetical protein